MSRVLQLQGKRNYDKEIESLVSLIKNREPGQVVTYIEMVDACGLDRVADRAIWQQVIKKVKRIMLETRGIAMRCSNNVGYRLLTPSEQLRNQDHELSARRKLQKGVTEKALIHQDKLTDQEKQLQLALVHQGAQSIDVLRTQAAHRKSFLASPDAVNLYNRVNSLRPQAVLKPPIEEEEKKKPL